VDAEAVVAAIAVAEAASEEVGEASNRDLLPPLWRSRLYLTPAKAKSSQ
jgi:hypothetical protein